VSGSHVKTPSEMIIGRRLKMQIHCERDLVVDEYSFWLSSIYISKSSSAVPAQQIRWQK
jgi:hypothetical protein